MFIKFKNSTKTLLQVGYTKSEVSVSETSETNSYGVVTITYDFGSGNLCIECSDEDVLVRLNQLDDYVKSVPITGSIYNIKWSDAKVDGSHFSGDDTAKDARLLAEEWTRIRTERTRLLAETDYLGHSDMTMNDAWKVYRQTLRNIPSVQSSKTTYASITWPTKP